MTSQEIIEKIDDELILRRATPADTEALAQFNGHIHAEKDEKFLPEIAAWVSELMNGEHPTCKAEDFILVENTRTKEVISSMCLIDQTWSYEGIEFKAGRPELVGTNEAYRRRGLVRKEFEAIHQWSAKRGQVLQFITGIPWFYRQFGYEMALEYEGNRKGSIFQIPELEKDKEEKYLFRKAEEKDLPFITELYNKNSRRSMVSCVRNESIWHYEALVRSPESVCARQIEIIQTPEGERVGYIFMPTILHRENISVTGFEVCEGTPWFDAAHTVLRRIKAHGEELAQQKSTPEKEVKLKSFNFSLGSDHPVYHVIPDRIPQVKAPYAFYIRVADLPGFLNRISPALEERLANSVMAGYSCELKLNLYTGGIRMQLENGKFTKIEAYSGEDASVNFPNLTFLHLLFGHRDVQALSESYVDMYCRHEYAKPLLDALFPPKPSYVLEMA